MMWVAREHYYTLLGNVEKEREKVAQLQARLASMLATQDWLTMHVNRLEHERTILMRERLHVVFPAPEIAHEQAPAALPGVAAGRPLPPDPDVERGVPEDSMGVAQLLSASLEDVGDEMAGRLGIKHNEAGEAVYTR